MDVGPTVLDLFGLPVPGSFMGESLVPFLRGKDPKLTRPIAVDAGRRLQALYFPDGMKAIVDLKRHTEELYDLHVDPKETDNRIEADPRSVYYLRAHRTFFDAHKLRRPGYVAPWRKF
jgi:arylsulfatase A-like enzyme